MKFTIFIITTILIALAAIPIALIFMFGYGMPNQALISSFQECKDAGYPIMESYPEQCRTPEGQIFVNTTNQNPPTTQTATFGTPITLTQNQSTTFANGLTVTLQTINDSRCKQGMVCVWAGELSATVGLSGQNTPGQQQFTLGQVTGRTITLGNYDFTLNNITETSATLLVTTKNTGLGPCYVGGCSSQLCTDRQDIASTCEWRQEYACYHGAECKRQSNGQCGWTQTPQLTACLSNAK